MSDEAVRWAAVVKAVHRQLGPDAEPVKPDGDEHVLLITGAGEQSRVRYRLEFAPWWRFFRKRDSNDGVTAFLLLDD